MTSRERASSPTGARRSRRSRLAASPLTIGLAVAACHRVSPRVPDDLAGQGVHRLALATGDAHGLSGLALATDGALWTVAERSAAAFRIDLDLDLGDRPPTVTKVERHPVVGLPDGEELESLATVAGGALLAGTEGRADQVVHAYRLEPDGERLEVRGAPITLGADLLGVAAGGNHGIEGACAVPGTTVLAIEATGRDADGRWAPIVTIAADAPAAPRVHRLRLTTATGKISALDCWLDDGRLRVIAIERHFEVTRILGFDVGAGPGPIVPTVLVDLGPILHGSLNLEGLVRLADGHLIAVVDNQYGRLTGPDELLWFAAIPTW